MNRRIVVPVNETAQSERALPVAVALARRMHAPLVLVTAVSWPNWDRPGHVGYHESLMQPYDDVEAESVTVKAVTETAAAIRSVCGPEDIVCIGAGRTSVFAELVLSSVTFDLVRAFHGPVIVVGPKATLPAGATRMLICVDGHERAEQGLQLIGQVAEPAGFDPFLVQAVHSGGAGTVPPSDTAESGYVHALAARAGAAKPIGWDVLHGEPVDAVATYAADPDIALVGLATDALDAFGRLISPSVANDLLDRCPRPLVLVSPTRPLTVSRHRIERGQPAIRPSGQTTAFTGS